MTIRCATCNRELLPDAMLMFEMSMDDRPVKKSNVIVKGFTCVDLECLAGATVEVVDK